MRQAKSPVMCPNNLVGTPQQIVKLKKWANGICNSGTKSPPRTPPRPRYTALEVTLMLSGYPKCPRSWR